MTKRDDRTLEVQPIEIDVEPTRAVPADTLPHVAVPVDAPTRLGRYTLLGLLGKGGMAEVYLAKQDGPAGFQKQCVVKRIRRSLSEEPRFVDMFLREARVAARLNHPNAVQIFELGQDGNEYFLAMEFLDGVSLHRAARRSWHQGESVPMEVTLRAAADAALGLHHAHSLTGVDGKATPLVHRDVSPDNIMLTRDGVAKVLDFGIAKSTDVDEQTGTGEVKGKIPFMSPEQLMGQPLDGRTDLWALGVTLYWLLTGTRPFDGPTEPMTIDGILRKNPRPLREVNPLIPVPVERMILSLLEKDRTKRIPSGAVLADRLLELLGPSAGYSAAATFCAKAMNWPDADPKQPISVLTILAARPESTWLKRLDEASGVGAQIDRLFPERTPTDKRQAARPPSLEPATAGTVTGIAAVKSSSSKLAPIAAGVVVALALGAVALWFIKPRDDRVVEAAPWVVPVAPPQTPPQANPAPTPPPPMEAAAPSEAPVVKESEEPKAKHEQRDDGRVAIRASAPSSVSWKVRGAGNGSGTIHIARGTAKITAVDGETGGTINVPVVDGVADYGAVPTGTLNVRVKPYADVEIGRKKFGTTPIDPVTLKAGHYTVHLVRDQMTKNIGVDVKAGSTATVTADMRDD